MSGGSFRYAYNHVEQFVEELQAKIDNNDKPDVWGDGYNFSPEVRAKLQSIVDESNRAAKLMKEAEWLCSGDTGEDTFLERVAEIGDLPSGWQPIDTAPKDRSDVWLFCPNDEPQQCVGFFCNGDGGYWEPTEKLVADVVGAIEPTHWMPLPDAPKVEDGKP